MEATLAQLLENPAIWRGNELARATATVPSGFAEFDPLLPGGGWPRGSLTEILLEREGIGELSLTLPAVAALTRAGRQVVWISPPYRPYGPALVAAGVHLPRLVVVTATTPTDRLWAFEQALRARECAAAFAWLATGDERVLRRLQIAAREGDTWGVLWRRPGQQATTPTAALRLKLAPREGRLEVELLKRRGGPLAQPLTLSPHHAVGVPLVSRPAARSVFPRLAVG